MRRRAYLGVVAALFAGCSGDDGSPGPTDTTTETGSPSPTPNPSPTATATASLTVSEFAVPSIVEIGEPFTATLTIANGGPETRSFESAVSAKYGSGEWTDAGSTVSVDVPSGETVTTTVEMGPEPFVRPASYRLDATGTIARTSAVGRELRWGGTHRLPNGIELTVSEPSFPETYTFETSDGSRTEPPPDDERWAIVGASAENVGEEPAAAPSMPQLQLHEGENEFRGEPLGNENLDQYRGGEVEPGEVASGDVPASISADLGLPDLHLEYSATYEGGDVDLTWTATSGE